MSASAEAFVVPSDQVAAAWPDIARLVSRVTEVPWSLADIRNELEEQRAQAWGVRRGTEVTGVLITKIESTLTHTYGVVWIAAGADVPAGMRMLREQIEPWMFNDMSCEWIEVQGRKGWRKLLPDYDESAVVLRKYNAVR